MVGSFSESSNELCGRVQSSRNGQATKRRERASLLRRLNFGAEGR